MQLAKRDLSHTSFLVVEDNAHMRSILRSILAGFGVRQIFDAGDGADGLEFAIERYPDVILLDWSMVPVSGSDFLRILRAEKDHQLRTTPVLIVSAQCQRSTVIEAVKLGIHGFIAKPVSPTLLYQHVVNILMRQDSEARTMGIGLKRLPKREQPLAALAREARGATPPPAPADAEDDSDMALL
ncbi:chemotaxis response regulator protein-glutamate methylesterase 1 [Roseibium sp. TrichSKD4]|uniref:response regulator n=1 Tax=Roseibium sp. TrichSKD4 TaxID=744980 RepID=UPI0001E57797|nr:response regulator [Roseibium sp. TrichSKD4]EFO29559.1 chemotaxis response regulator protein-glutamate methylesterase 1 [Roseibium sp. TrichSKD4]